MVVAVAVEVVAKAAVKAEAVEMAAGLARRATPLVEAELMLLHQQMVSLCGIALRDCLGRFVEPGEKTLVGDIQQA